MAEIDELRARVAELEALINTPQTINFLEAVKLEAAHQVERWGRAHDRNKMPADWFWLVGYLAGKALQHAILGNREKALHHTISAAAALANWHAAILEGSDGSQPVQSDVEQAIADSFGKEATDA